MRPAIRLREIDKGDGIVSHLLISFISLTLRMRLPDAARVAFYHKDFFSDPMGAWTQEAMRGPSDWTVGERELMAALVAKWNSCRLCVGAHGSVSVKELKRSTVDAALADYHAAPIWEGLKVTLEFLEVMTLRPAELTSENAKAVFEAGVGAEALKDAIAVGAIFNIVTRYAYALDFAVPTADEFDRAASMLLKRGYRA
jgi:AhpD family alkylhydroperoxidase